MADVDVKFTGGRELDRAMSRLRWQVERKIARQALRAGGKVYQKELRDQLPRSGEPTTTIGGTTVSKQALADSIKVARPRDRRQDLLVRIGVAGLARLYAHIIEYGNSDIVAQPVWRPVFRRLAQKVIRTVAAKLGTDIIKEVRRGN